MISEKQKNSARLIALCIDNFNQQSISQEKIFKVEMDENEPNIQEFFQYFSMMFGYDGNGRPHINIAHNKDFDKFVMTIPTSLKTVLTATYTVGLLTITVNGLSVDDADPKEFPAPGLSPTYSNGKVVVPYHLFIELSQIVNETPFYKTIYTVIKPGDRYKFVTQAVVVNESDYEALVDRYVECKMEDYLWMLL